MRSLAAPLFAAALVLAACSSTGDSDAPDAAPSTGPPGSESPGSAAAGGETADSARFRYPAAPVTPDVGSTSPSGADYAIYRINAGLENGGRLDAGGVTLLA